MPALDGAPGEVQGRVNDAASILSERWEWVEKREILPLVAMTLPAKLPVLANCMIEGTPSNIGCRAQAAGGVDLLDNTFLVAG